MMRLAMRRHCWQLLRSMTSNLITFLKPSEKKECYMLIRDKIHTDIKLSQHILTTTNLYQVTSTQIIEKRKPTFFTINRWCIAISADVFRNTCEKCPECVKMKMRVIVSEWDKQQTMVNLYLDQINQKFFLYSKRRINGRG
jgi:hypothetical protein